ncbi:hypothetical protein BDZ89DRAFT_1128688 [Hymenopellis radicata]|nr:hypothetical protein BDZ89DRAFT_1128688 [Hymenopellis radicata]
MNDAASVSSGPPSYPSSLSARSDIDLPSYSPPTLSLRRPRTAPQPRPPVEHKYELLSGNGTAWATLKVQSRSRSSQQMPTFAEGDKVNGSLVLDLKKNESIKSIHLVVCHLYVPLYLSFLVDLDSFRLNTVLWERSNPHEKLHGQNEWPFSLDIPKEITVDETDAQTHAGPFRLPQTFLEKNVQASVQYDLVVNMKRTGFASSNSRIQTMIAYVPLTRPDPPSFLRRLAYQENSPLLGPEADPEGWQLLPPCSVNGTLFSNRQVNVNCQLYLAKPLCYTRGTSVPCFMSVTCMDEQALDLVATSSAIHVRLRRYVTAFNKDAALYNHSNLTGMKAAAPLGNRRYSEAATAKWTDAVEDLANGVWWPSREGGEVIEGTRRLNGEIKLDQSLKPTCRIGNFRIKYMVVLLPPTAVGFARPSGLTTTPLLEREIEIATIFAPGPRALIYTPNSRNSQPRTSGGDNYLIPPVASFVS